MYGTFKEAGTPLPRDPALVDYGFNLEEEEVFQEAVPSAESPTTQNAGQAYFGSRGALVADTAGYAEESKDAQMQV